jgi:TPR repeat protein
LGNIYYFAKGVKQDFVMAKKVFEAGCSVKSAKSCLNLGIIYAKGQGLPQDTIKAKQLFQQSCDFGYDKGCDYIERVE